MTIQKFDLYAPTAPSASQTLLLNQEHPFKKSKYYYFVFERDFLLIYREELKTNLETGEKRLLADQIEIPFAGVRWFINAIEQKFFKSPEEGGLPANKISYRETVSGERLHLLRSANAGCEHPGYALTNLERQSYILALCKQDISFADPWLFQHGLMDFLKELADKYESGQL